MSDINKTPEARLTSAMLEAVTNFGKDKIGKGYGLKICAQQISAYFDMEGLFPILNKRFRNEMEEWIDYPDWEKFKETICLYYFHFYSGIFFKYGAQKDGFELLTAIMSVFNASLSNANSLEEICKQLIEKHSKD